MKKGFLVFILFIFSSQIISAFDINQAFEEYQENGNYVYKDTNIISNIYSSEYIGFEDFIKEVGYKLTLSEEKTINGLTIALNQMSDEKLNELILKIQNLTDSGLLEKISKKDNVLIYAINDSCIEILERRGFEKAITDLSTINMRPIGIIEITKNKLYDDPTFSTVFGTNQFSDMYEVITTNEYVDTNYFYRDLTTDKILSTPSPGDGENRWASFNIETGVISFSKSWYTYPALELEYNSSGDDYKIIGNNVYDKTGEDIVGKFYPNSFINFTEDDIPDTQGCLDIWGDSGRKVYFTKESKFFSNRGFNDTTFCSEEEAIEQGYTKSAN